MMHSLGFYTLFAVAATKLAFAAAPDPVALAIVKQEFINAHIVPDDLTTFNPSGLLQVNFKGPGAITVGQQLPQNSTGSQPNVTVQSTNSTSSAKYTVMMVDFNYAGSTNPKGFYLHWLSNSNTIGSDGTLTPSSDVTEPYGGPAPPVGSGPHRYTIMLYDQPSNFTAPSTPKPRTGVQLFNFTQYITTTGLGSPIAAFYFTVENGAATVSVESTSTIDTKTISASSTGSNSGSSSASKPTSTTKKNAADTTTGSVSFVVGALSSVMFVAFVML